MKSNSGPRSPSRSAAPDPSRAAAVAVGTMAPSLIVLRAVPLHVQRPTGILLALVVIVVGVGMSDLGGAAGSVPPAVALSAGEKCPMVLTGGTISIKGRRPGAPGLWV